MSTSFDGGRFARLLRAHWAESWRDYTWFVAVAAMIDLIFIAIFISAGANKSSSGFQFNEQISWYATGLFASASIFAGRYFKHFTNPGAALIAFMRPASLFEKWILAFIFVCVLFPLSYTLVYSMLNYPAVQLAKAWYVAPANCSTCFADFRFYIPFLTAEMQKGAANSEQTFFRIQEFVLLVLWTIQALVLGGTIFFKRSPVLKTVLILFLLAIVVLWLGTPPQAGPFWSHASDDIIPYSAFESGLSLCQWVGLPLLLWVAVFFHLKEREVS